jgi:hypothetical protein
MIFAIGGLLLILLIFFLTFGFWGTLIGLIMAFGILAFIKFLLSKRQ